MAQKFYSNKILQFASKSFRLKIDGFQFYKGQYCAQYHGNSIVDFHVVYGHSSSTNCKHVKLNSMKNFSTIQYSVLNK